MKNNRVKHFSENGYEVLITSCKKVETAVGRFDDFLSHYDSYIRETALKAFMSVEVVGYLFDGGIVFHGVAVFDDCRVDVFYTNNGGVYRVEISFTSDTTEDTTDTTEDTTDTTEDTTDTTEDTKDTITICLGSLDSVHVEENKPLLPVPLWFYQRSNIYVWSAILAAYNCRYYCNRSKVLFVKPVPLSLSPLLEVRTGGEYPYKIVLSDGRLLWDCRSRVYNEYLSDLIGAPPYDELPF